MAAKRTLNEMNLSLHPLSPRYPTRRCAVVMDTTAALVTIPT